MSEADNAGFDGAGFDGAGSARATLDKRRGDIVAMFDRVATRYDLANDVLSLGQDRAWRRQVVQAVGPRPGQLILMWLRALAPRVSRLRSAAPP